MYNVNFFGRHSIIRKKYDGSMFNHQLKTLISSSFVRRYTRTKCLFTFFYIILLCRNSNKEVVLIYILIDFICDTIFYETIFCIRLSNIAHRLLIL